MFTVIAHDFQSDFFYGSVDCTSLKEAEVRASVLLQDVPSNVDVFIQCPDGAEIELPAP